eukprot:UN33874
MLSIFEMNRTRNELLYCHPLYDKEYNVKDFCYYASGKTHSCAWVVHTLNMNHLPNIPLGTHTIYIDRCIMRSDGQAVPLCDIKDERRMKWPYKANPTEEVTFKTRTNNKSTSETSYWMVYTFSTKRNNSFQEFYKIDSETFFVKSKQTRKRGKKRARKQREKIINRAAKKHVLIPNKMRNRMGA